MNEQEWLECTNPGQFLRYLGEKADSRKLRLFAAACCRRAWEYIPQAIYRQAIELAERFADHRANDQELKQASRDVRGLGGSEGSLSSNMVSHALLAPPYTWVKAFVTATHAVFLVTDVQQLRDDHAERPVQYHLLRDIFGNPFRPITIDPTCLTPTVLSLAQAVYDNRNLPSGTLDNALLRVLSDALEDAGASGAMLEHLRSEGPHVRGNFALDSILGLQ